MYSPASTVQQAPCPCAAFSQLIIPGVDSLVRSRSCDDKLISISGWMLPRNYWTLTK